MKYTMHSHGDTISIDYKDGAVVVGIEEEVMPGERIETKFVFGHGAQLKHFIERLQANANRMAAALQAHVAATGTTDESDGTVVHIHPEQ